MSILIIGAAFPATDTDRAYYDQYVAYFESVVKPRNPNTIVKTVMLEELLISVGDGSIEMYDTRNQLPLDEYQVIILRGHGFPAYMDVVGTLTEYAKLHSIKLINKFEVIRNTSKLMQATQFFVHSIPVAKTFYVNDALLRHQELSKWKFPSIMKATIGSHGNDNYVVKSFEEVASIAAEDPKKRFVLQRFVPNDGDYRVLIIGDEVLVIGRSAVGGSHLNNTSQGGAATLVGIKDLPDGVIAQSREIMEAYGMSIAGVDVLIDKETGEYSFLEVNAQPQLMTGAFVQDKKKALGAYLSTLLY
jgi:glutathione synthase/RimK-type ligase-like ATP-grasp enzyme